MSPTSLMFKSVLHLKPMRQALVLSRLCSLAKTTGSDGLISHFLNKQNIILIVSVLVLGLSYFAEVASPDVRRDWSVRCCGKSFWWSPVGCAVLLVAASALFRVRRNWSWISAALLTVYVLYDFVYQAVELSTYYYSLDKMEAMREALLLPLYRPLGSLLALYIFAVALKNLLHKSIE